MFHFLAGKIEAEWSTPSDFVFSPRKKRDAHPGVQISGWVIRPLLDKPTGVMVFRCTESVCEQGHSSMSCILKAGAFPEADGRGYF